MGELVQACTFVADTRAINRFMVKAHFEYWHSRGLLCSASSTGATSSTTAALAGTGH